MEDLYKKSVNKIIVALDLDSAQKAIAMAETLSGTGVKFKIGMELFYSAGPTIIEKLKKHGDIFLDLKLHDIPNTMAQAAKTLVKFGVWMFNVHASAGEEALTKVAEAVRETAENEKRETPKVIGVTVLTSLKDLAHLGSTKPAEQTAFDLAKLCADSGLNGIVCAANDVPFIKSELDPSHADFLYVTPGIRLPENKDDDQKRVMTPKQALDNGASYLVIGRPITKAKDSRAALEKVLTSLDTLL